MSFRLQKNLMGHWPLNNNAQDVVGVNDGVWDGNELYSPGPFGQSVGKFDGNPNSWVNTSDSPIFDTVDELTVSIWFRTNVQQGDKGLMLHDNSAYKYMMYLTGNSGDLYWFVHTDPSGDAVASYLQPDGFFSDGRPHHVAGTYNQNVPSDRLALYVDGELVDTSNGVDEPIEAGDEGISIGRYLVSEFSGDEWHARIYNKGATWDEVKKLNRMDRGVSR